jgi:hypothetical protein
MAEAARKTNGINYQDIDDLEPVESASTELSRIMAEGDPDAQLAILEKKATLAPRYTQAISTILISQTYPEDWKIFDGKACLSSAGAERVARLFDIKFFDIKNKKEDFTDANGGAYRYVFEGMASMGTRIVYAQGVYSTRDKFLGYANQEWKPLENINENHIRNAAYHIFIGNAVKALLGLRAMPEAEFNKLMSGVNKDGKKAGAVSHGSGTQGGSSQDEHNAQKQLGEALLAIANAGFQVAINEEGKHFLEQISETSDPMEVAKASCVALTSFKGNKGDIVKGLDSAKAVKGKRLEIALKNALALKETAEKEGAAPWEQ